MEINPSAEGYVEYVLYWVTTIFPPLTVGTAEPIALVGLTGATLATVRV